MEAVAQTIFAVPGVSGKAQGAVCEQTKGESFDNIAKKLFELISAEKESDPLALFSRLQQDIATLLEAAEILSSQEQTELTSEVMQQIRDLLASGEEGQVAAFLQGLVQIASEPTLDAEKLIDLAESFSAGTAGEETVDLSAGSGKVAEKEGKLSVGKIPEAEKEGKLSVGKIPEAEKVPGAENSSQEVKSGSNEALPFEERATAMLKEKAVAELVGSQSGRESETDRSGPSLEAVQQIERLLSRRLATVEGKSQGMSQALLEKAPFFKGVDVQTLEFLSPESEVSEETLEAKLNLLQQIRDIADKAEFRQSSRAWEAKIELKPEQLGSTLLKMNMVRDKASLDIFVARPEAQEMVQSSLDELEQIFTDKGIVLEGINVEVDPNMQFAQGTLSRENWDKGSFPETVFAGTEEAFSGGGNEIYSPENLFLDTERVNCFA